MRDFGIAKLMGVDGEVEVAGETLRSPTMPGPYAPTVRASLDRRRGHAKVEAPDPIQMLQPGGGAIGGFLGAQ